MSTTSLTSGDDTVTLYEGFFGQISGSGWVSLRGVTLDGAAGTDVLMVDYPDSIFTVTESTSGVVTLSTASGGSVSLVNFEQIQFKNSVIDLTPSVSTTPTTGNDALTGTAGADLLSALAGQDTLTGGAGHDTLDGGTGIDWMIGGTGNDVYVIDTLEDILTEKAGEGTDRVNVNITTTGGSYTLAAEVENATLVQSQPLVFSLIGNALANTLTGHGAANGLQGGAGRDELRGLAGQDTLAGGTGADTLAGGTGHDTLTGGSGSDVFVFDASLQSGASSDRILDYGGADRIALDDAIFHLGITGTAAGVSLASSATAASVLVLGTRAASTEDHLIYNANTGQLFYDPTGSTLGASDQVLVATLGNSTHPTLSASDFLVI